MGRDNTDTLMSVNNIGTLLYCTGKLSLAESFYRRTGLSRDVSGCWARDHQTTLGSVNNIGFVLQAQGAATT